MVMGLWAARRTVAATLLFFAAAAPAFAQDAGELDPSSAARVHADKALFALCGPQLSDATAVWRYAPAYVVLDGCGRIRRHDRAARGIPVCQRRGNHGIVGSARQALPATRLSRRGGSLGQHGILPRHHRRQARVAGRPDGTPLVRPDRERQWGARRQWRSSPRFRRDSSRRRWSMRPARPRIAMHGLRRSPRLKNTMSRVASRHLSATSGRRWLPTTTTATSYFATTATRPARCIPFTVVPAVGQPAGTGPVSVDARLRGKDRRAGVGHRAQRQRQ